MVNLARLPRLPGESPCAWEYGAEGWVMCKVHGWNGPKEQRTRVLVCEDAATAPQAIRVHYGDPDDRARAYNQGYDDAWQHARELEAVEVGRLNVERLGRALHAAKLDCLPACDEAEKYPDLSEGMRASGREISHEGHLLDARKVAEAFARLTLAESDVPREWHGWHGSEPCECP